MELRTADVAVLIAYIIGVVVFGCWFVRRSNTTEGFTAAGGSLPGWAVGLSIFGTYLSSNTFLGFTGKAYAGNWNTFVFSLSLPFAAWIAVRYFVPFYRESGEISAYTHLEKRFGAWARTYAVICYLLLQISRVGTILFGVALALNALLGWDMAWIIVATGVLVTLYTLLGGIAAVIWTDVAQSIVLTIGALIAAVLLLLGMPEGSGQIFEIAAREKKFSLGSFGPSLVESTFWVVIIYGIFENLKNFGIDQSFVQRYHTARSDAAARRSVWLGALLFIPVAALFLFIGTALFAYYDVHPAELDVVREKVVAERIESNPGLTVAELQPKDFGDKVFPHFIVTHLPTGLAGLLIAALFAAAMSSVDSSLNSSATVILTDLYKRYVRPDVDERGSLRVLHIATIVWGAVGTGVGLAMIGVKSILDVWWKIAGVFSGAMLGLFLLGFLARSVRAGAAATGVTVGVLVILWLSLSPGWESLPKWGRNPLHGYLTIVIGTLTIFFIGLGAGRVLFGKRP